MIETITVRQKKKNAIVEPLCSFFYSTFSSQNYYTTVRVRMPVIYIMHNTIYTQSFALHDRSPGVRVTQMCLVQNKRSFRSGFFEAKLWVRFDCKFLVGRAKWSSSLGILRVHFRCVHTRNNRILRSYGVRPLCNKILWGQKFKNWTAVERLLVTKTEAGHSVSGDGKITNLCPIRFSL